MKHLITAATLATLVFATAALAATSSVSGTAFSSKPLTVPFTTSSAGAVSVNATWNPSGKTRYVLTVKHLTNPSDTFSYDQICQVYEPLNGQGSGQTVGDYTCSFASGKAGFWSAEFRPITGKVSAVLTVETP